MRSPLPARVIAVVAVVVTATACGLSADTGDGTLPESASTVATTTTTTTPPTTTTATHPVTTTTVPMAVPDLLRASIDGIELLSDGVYTSIWSEAPVAIALADGRDGIVFQRLAEAAISWSLDRAAGRLVPSWWSTADGSLLESGESPPIEQVGLDGGAGRVLVPGGRDQAVVLKAVTEVAGRRVVLFTRESAVGDCPLPLFEPTCWDATLTTRLVAKDLDGGDEWDLGPVGGSIEGWQWGARVAIAGHRLAISRWYIEEVGTPTLEVAELDDDLEWGVAGVLPEPGVGSVISSGEGYVPSPVALSPDGRSLAYSETLGVNGSVMLVVVDLDTGSELLRVRTGDRDLPRWLWFDGETLLVGASIAGNKVVDLGGSMVTLSPTRGMYSFWSEGSRS